MILIDRYVDFLIKTKITERQFLVLYLAYTKRGDLVTKYKANLTNGMKIIPEKELIELEKKKLIIKTPNGGFILSKDFMNIFIDKHIATEEVFAIYPTFLYKDGVHIPLSAMDRNVFATLYEIAIMGSLEEHKEILEDIKYGKEHNLLNIGIEKFIKSRLWISIRQKRLENKEVLTRKIAADNEF